MAEPVALDPNLLGLSRGELEQFALACGQPRFRGGQLYKAIYSRGGDDFTAFTDLDKEFRAFLSAHHTIRHPEIRKEFVSRDGSVRYVLGLQDDQSVEAVYMPEKDRATLCLSSQVGCPVDCRFCFTGLLGLKRNLSAGEMVGQVLALLRAQSVSIGESLRDGFRLNVVFMGMGEPLLNLSQVMKAVRILADRAGIGIPLRRITISTSGIVPRILDLARELVRPKLAVSLNASTDEQRTALMPLNRRYPLKDLLSACRAYPLRPRERLTFEYVLLDGINDSDQDAVRVAELLRGIRCKVNLIPYNPGPELPYRPSPLERALAFQQVLVERHVPVFIRISRGQDVMAACGQLSLAEARA
jgi:23S rRNA (adenine2503-C2)-methyltransferase